ncbi:MAG: BF3164 family lipoprotein [Bacteroidota bacterium]
MKKRILIGCLAAILCITLFSCADKQNDSDIKKIDWQKKPIYNPQLRVNKVEGNLLNPRKICTTNEYIVVLNKSDKKILSLYQNKGDSIVFCGNFLNRGKGPQEVTAIDAKSFHLRNDKIQFCDLRNLYELELDQDTIRSFKRIFRFPRKFYPINHGFSLKKGCVLRNSAYGEETETKEFHWFLSEEDKAFGEYPTFLMSEKINGNNMKDLWQVFEGGVNISSGGDKMMAYYNYFPYIKIFNIKNFDSPNQLLYSSVEQQIFFKNGEFNPSHKNIIYGSQAYSTNKYIYLMVYENSAQKLREINPDAPSIRPHILVFDWNGNAKWRINLDKLITTFAVSKDDSILYGASAFDQNVIYSCNLKKI